MSEPLDKHRPFRDAVFISICTIIFAPPLVAIFVVMTNHIIRYFIPPTINLFKSDLFNDLMIAVEFSYVFGIIPAIFASFVVSICSWKFKALKLKNVLIISVLTMLIFVTLISILNIMNSGYSDLTYEVLLVFSGAGLFTGYILYKVFYRWLSVSKLSLVVDLDNKGVS